MNIRETELPDQVSVKEMTAAMNRDYRLFRDEPIFDEFM